MKTALIKMSLGTLILATSLAGVGCTYYKMDGTPLGGKTVTTTNDGTTAGNTTPAGDPSSGGTTVVTPPAVCGNGVVETGEQCDDSNTVSGDGCDATCQTEVSVTPPPTPAPPMCKKGPADGACSSTSECCGGTICRFDCHDGVSYCLMEVPPTCGGTSGGGEPSSVSAYRLDSASFDIYSNSLTNDLTTCTHGEDAATRHQYFCTNGFSHNESEMGAVYTIKPEGTQNAIQVYDIYKGQVHFYATTLKNAFSECTRGEDAATRHQFFCTNGYSYDGGIAFLVPR